MERHERSNKRVKISDEVGIDRLSNLPDFAIHHILSLMDAKNAVRTCVLSRKWKFHWAYVPCYRFDLLNYAESADFEDFVISLLSYRKLLNVSKPELCFKGAMVGSFVKVSCHYVRLYRAEEIDVRKQAAVCDHMVVDRLSSLPDHLIYHILSLVDTKYAVQTCVLSKKWRNYWTNIHSLNLVHSSFSRWVCFSDFVFILLQRLKSRKPSGLRKLSFRCGGTFRVKLVRAVIQFAISLGVEEIDSEVLSSFHPSLVDCRKNLFECQTLKTLNTYASETDFGKFVALKNLKMSIIYFTKRDLFSDCLKLENLVVNRDRWFSFKEPLIISAPQLISLAVTDKDGDSKNIEITAPKLKFFYYKGFPQLLSFDECSLLDEVKLNLSPTKYHYVDRQFASKMKQMIEGLCDSKSISIAINLSKLKFRLYYSSVHDEVKVTKLNQESGKEDLLSTFSLVNCNKLLQLAIISGGLLDAETPLLEDHTETDRLSNLPDPIVHHILSLMNTKAAVRTCVLSKQWRYKWTHIPSLNFVLTHDFPTLNEFRTFILNVMRHRKASKLKRLKFHLRDYKSQSVAKLVADYALKQDLEEFDTNFVVFPSSLYKCQNLRTLKLGPCSLTSTSPDISGFSSLTTLQLTDVWLSTSDLLFNCLIIKNLYLVDCRLSSILEISAPNLSNLTITNCKPVDEVGKIVMSCPGLKIVNLYGSAPLELNVGDCPTLESVIIHQSVRVYGEADGKKKVANILDSLIHMVDVFNQAKTLKVSLSFPKEKFILSHSMVDGGCKLMELNKETGSERLAVGIQ